MSRQLDFDKPLTGDDKQYALDRGLVTEVQANESRFRVLDGEPSETTSATNYTDTGQTFAVQDRSGLNGNEPSGTADRLTPAGLGEAMSQVNRDRLETVVEVVEEGETPAKDDEDYDTWTVVELQEELNSRELSKSGNKAELVARLKADDEEGA